VHWKYTTATAQTNILSKMTQRNNLTKLNRQHFTPAMHGSNDALQ
jgi:hypothetical protein